MIDFRLRSFIEVHRLQGFTRAAERLHLTQPAVTQHVKKLEEELGKPLFEIKGRSVELTEAGALLMRFALHAEADARRTREGIAALGKRTVLRFGATRTIGEFVLPPSIASWLEAYPESDVAMRVDNTDALFGALRGGDLDFIFVEGCFAREDYQTEVLDVDELVPVCAPGHPFAGRTVSIEEALPQTLVAREGGSGGRALLEKALEGLNLRISDFGRVLEIGSVGAVKELAARGAGIAFLYGASVARELADGRLARFAVEGLAIRHDYTFVRLKDSLPDDGQLRFLAWCRERRGPAPTCDP